MSQAPQHGLSPGEWEALLDVHYAALGQSGSGRAHGPRVTSSLLRRGLIVAREFGGFDLVLTPKGRAAVGVYLASEAPKDGSGGNAPTTAEARSARPSSDPAPPLPVTTVTPVTPVTPANEEDAATIAYNTTPGNRPFD